MMFLLKSKTMDVSNGTGTAYPSRAPEFTPGFQWGLCYSIFSFICVLCRSLFVLLYFFFLLAIVLSVLLRYTDSDYPFGIFKLFLHMKIHRNQIINISVFSHPISDGGLFHLF